MATTVVTNGPRESVDGRHAHKMRTKDVIKKLGVAQAWSASSRAVELVADRVVIVSGGGQADDS